MACPDENALLDYAEGRLAAVEREAIDEHLDRCPDCRDAMAPLIGRPRRRRRTLRPGDRAGRFVIGEPLGRGGMGVVYAAHDTELGRKVAVKVLRVHALRLTREAQAIARVSDPNVVTVFEIGTLADGDLFVAMEFVDGITLRRWLPREPAEVLRVMIAAGRGLAAAHRAGVVHRDFKPDNVMIANDGTVKVLDFGLALAGGSESTSTETDRGAFDLELTRTGTVMGTPAYMAPEQHEGRVDERSDQFAFCVALYEGMFGQRPFLGESADELAAAKQRGIEIPRARGRWRKALQRGLEPDPAARFESMTALLDALQAVPSSSRRIALAVATGVVAVAAAGWVTARPPTIAAAPIETATSAAGLSPVQQQTIDRARDLRWQARYAEALALCDRELATADATPTFAAAVLIERGLVRAADSAAQDAYADYERAFEVARGVGADAIAARAALLAAHVGAYQTAMPVTPEAWLRHADPLIERLGDPIDLVQQREATLAKLANARGDAAAAEPYARRELALAEQMEDPARIAAALSSLAGAVWMLGDPAEAERLFEREIELTREHLGDDHPSLASGLINLGSCQAARGELDAAEASLREALRVLAMSDVTRDADVGFVWIQLGKIAMQRGDHEAAAAARVQAVALIERERGADHPWVADALYDLALVHFARGTLDEAEPLLWRAAAIVQAARGDDAKELAYYYNALADIEHEHARPEAALELRERASAIVGEESELDDYIAIGRARDFLDLQRLDEAETALATVPSCMLPPSERSAPVLEVQGQLALQRGRASDAVPLLERAVELIAQDVSAEPLRRLALLRSLADALDASHQRPRDAARLRRDAAALHDAMPR